MCYFEDLLHEKEAILQYLKKHDKTISKVPKLLAPNSLYLDLLPSKITASSPDYHEWMTANYDRNPLYPEHLIHTSISGNTVRSKSEVIIDMSLYLNNLPYRYECALQFDDITLYPDFMVPKPSTGEIIYWDHFGMMDNPAYAKKAYQKLDLYASNGYVPTINLIATFETKNHPLTSSIVNKIIAEYFLQ